MNKPTSIRAFTTSQIALAARRGANRQRLRQLPGRGIAPSQPGGVGTRRQKPLGFVSAHRSARAAARAMERSPVQRGLSPRVSPSGPDCALPAGGGSPASSHGEGRHGHWWAELTGGPKDTPEMAAPKAGPAVPTRLGRQQLPPSPPPRELPPALPRQCPRPAPAANRAWQGTEEVVSAEANK